MPRTAALALAVALLASGGGCSAGARVANDGFGRDDRQRDAVIALLGIDPGDTVVDLGARDDYFARRFSEAVGETGRVLSAQPGESKPFANQDGAVDLLLVRDAYHEISDRPGFFRDALAALVPNGRVAIVEGGTPRDVIAREMREAGYEQIADHEIPTLRSVQIFRADDGTGE